MRSPLVLRTFLLRECDKTPAEMDLHDALLAALGHGEWATRIWNWALGRTPVDAGDQASHPRPLPRPHLSPSPRSHWTLQKGSWRTGWLPPSQEALAALLRCALEIGTIDAAAHVISARRYDKP